MSTANTKPCANPTCDVIIFRANYTPSRWAELKFCGRACARKAQARPGQSKASHCRGPIPHELTDDNVYVSTRADGTVQRRCRACNLAYDAKRRGASADTPRPRRRKPAPVPAPQPVREEPAPTWRPPGWVPVPLGRTTTPTSKESSCG